MESRQRNYFPVLLLLITVLIGLGPVPFAGSSSQMPSFAMITVFFWSLLRPAHLPALAIFIAGLILDAFAAPALGMHILTLMLLRMLAISFASRFSRQTIWFFWGGFFLLSLPCWITYWLLAALVSGDTSLSLLPALRQWGFTALWYPLLHLAFTRCLAILPLTR